MSPTIACPEQSDLLAFAAGDAPSPTLKVHVADCPACRRIVRRLKVEIGFLRSSVRSGFRPTPHSWAGRPIYGES